MAIDQTVADAIFNKKSQSNLGRAVSPPLTAENNYATKSPLVTMGCLTFTPKSPPHLIDYTKPSTDPTQRPKRHPDPISRFATVHRPSDRQTD